MGEFLFIAFIIFYLIGVAIILRIAFRLRVTEASERSRMRNIRYLKGFLFITSFYCVLAIPLIFLLKYVKDFLLPFWLPTMSAQNLKLISFVMMILISAFTVKFFDCILKRWKLWQQANKYMNNFMLDQRAHRRMMLRLRRLIYDPNPAKRLHR